MTNVTFSRLARDERKLAVLNAAVKLCEKPGGFANLQRGSVATEAGCSASLVNHYFGDLASLRKAVVRHAIKEQNLSIIGQAIISRDRAALKVPDQLKRNALAHAVA